MVPLFSLMSSSARSSLGHLRRNASISRRKNICPTELTARLRFSCDQNEQKDQYYHNIHIFFTFR
jgi:hypothetical protein